MRQTLLIIIGTFIVGLMTGGLLNSITTGDVQAAAITPQTALTSKLDVAAPSDHVPENTISVLKDQVVIRVPNAVWAKFTPTGSMKPVFDESANAIEIVPKSPSQIKVGDIISYQSDWIDAPVIHRVVEIGEDGQGWYAIVKGDNNGTADPGKIRFSQVRRLVIAIIY